MTVGSDDPNENQDFILGVTERFWHYGNFVKGCHVWPVCGRVYVMCVRFSHVGCTSIRITDRLSHLCDRTASEMGGLSPKIISGDSR
jgi:hypothetical protein